MKYLSLFGENLKTNIQNQIQFSCVQRKCLISQNYECPFHIPHFRNHSVTTLQDKLL